MLYDRDNSSESGWHVNIWKHLMTERTELFIILESSNCTFYPRGLWVNFSWENIRNKEDRSLPEINVGNPCNLVLKRTLATIVWVSIVEQFISTAAGNYDKKWNKSESYLENEGHVMEIVGFSAFQKNNSKIQHRFVQLLFIICCLTG